MNKQQLASRIWNSANQMRSKIEANEFKDYILGFIFYKYLSDKLVNFAKKEDFNDEDIKRLSEADTAVCNHIKNNIGYFIAYPHLFSTWIEDKSHFDVSHVREALSAFSRLIHPNHKRLFEGIFKTLETGLSKLGDTAPKQTKAISDLIHLIKDIPMDGRQGYDVLGYIYEYLIGMFAANAGKKAGEFYTPHEVSVLISEIIANHLKDRKTIGIYDSTSGSGSLLLNIGEAIARHMLSQDNIKYYAQELKENTNNLTRMNLVMRGIRPANIETRNADTLEDDWPVDKNAPLYVDAVVSNPPYSQIWDPKDKESDPRYTRFGLAPKSKADYAFLLHDLYHLKPDGIMAIVLPHGVLFRGGEEGMIRKNLVENNHIETIIGLPPNIFFGTGIPTIIIILRQKRKDSDILIIDASKGFSKEGKTNKLRASDIKKIADTTIERLEISKYSRRVSKTEIQANDYNLNIPRYVDSSLATESWDIYASMFGGIPQSELRDLANIWQAFPKLRSALFADNGTPYVVPQVENIDENIRTHTQVKKFVEKFSVALADFDSELADRLVKKMLSIRIPQQEAIISEELFKRLAEIPLIDRYQAYQILDDCWQTIATDLEILQTEGFDASRLVEPKFITRKKDGKDTEVQEGWKGHILPFELVQSTYMKTELDAICVKEARLTEIATSLEGTLEGFSEEEKEAETVNEDGTKFVGTIVAKEAKTLIQKQGKESKWDTESYEAKIIRVSDWLTEEKSLKAEIKEETSTLDLKTKKTIEDLKNTQVYDLLKRKWIDPLLENLQRLPQQEIESLIVRLEALAEKYRITYATNAREIEETETELAGMIKDMDANEFDLKGLTKLKSLLTGK